MVTGWDAEQDPQVIDAMRGDRDAIVSLWREHRRWVAAVLMVHKPHAVDLDDLLQEVAMALVSKVHTLRDGTNLRAWLRTVAVNAARASARRARSRPRVAVGGDDPLTEPCGRESSVDVTLAADEATRRVMQQLERLPEVYREPLVLRALQGMSSAEISEILEIPPATVDTRVARARRMLRERLEALDEAQAGLDGSGEVMTSTAMAG